VLQLKPVAGLLIDFVWNLALPNTETLELLTKQTQRNQTQPNLTKRNQNETNLHKPNQTKPNQNKTNLT